MKEDRLKETSCCAHDERSKLHKYKDLKQSTKENFVTGTSVYYLESPEAVYLILNMYQPPEDGTSAGRKLGQGAKKAQCLHRSNEETTRGSPG